MKALILTAVFALAMIPVMSATPSLAKDKPATKTCTNQYKNYSACYDANVGKGMRASAAARWCSGKCTG